MHVESVCNCACMCSCTCMWRGVYVAVHACGEYVYLCMHVESMCSCACLWRTENSLGNHPSDTICLLFRQPLTGLKLTKQARWF